MLGRKSEPKQHFELNLPDVEKDQHSEVAHPQPHPEAEIVIPPLKRPFLTAQNIALIALLLLLLFAGMAIWSWSRLGSLQEIRRAETQRHELVIDSLIRVKAGLENNLVQLETAYADLIYGNDSLAQQLAAAANIIAANDSTMRANAREESALRAEVQRLQSVKDRYETVIALLNQNNAALIAENARLRGKSDSLTQQVSALGRQLEAQLRQTLAEQFKATAFRVEMRRRNDQLTLRAKRTRELSISFDLINVPPTYQGNRQLYLVITDDQGLPIASDNPVQATIKTDKGPVAIIAQATQFQNVVDAQRIVLNYKLEDRLKSGTYVVSVYSDKGLLGVASFRLT